MLHSCIIRAAMSTITAPVRLVSYLEQLDALAIQARISLLHAFIAAGVPSSTYYRTLNGAELRFETAIKVASYLRNQIKRNGNGHDARNGTAAIACEQAAVQ